MIEQNHFYDVSPEDARLSDDLLDYPFFQDILHLRNHQRRMVLDLGWYPDSDPNGQFRLRLIQWDMPPSHKAMPKQTLTTTRDGMKYTYALQPTYSGDAWSSPLIDFSSVDPNEIRAQIDDILARVASGELGTT